jgi:hypothetical protein
VTAEEIVFTSGYNELTVPSTQMPLISSGDEYGGVVDFDFLVITTSSDQHISPAFRLYLTGDRPAQVHYASAFITSYYSSRAIPNWWGFVFDEWDFTQDDLDEYVLRAAKSIDPRNGNYEAWPRLKMLSDFQIPSLNLVRLPIEGLTLKPGKLYELSAFHTTSVRAPPAGAYSAGWHWLDYNRNSSHESMEFKIKAKLL